MAGDGSKKELESPADRSLGDKLAEVVRGTPNELDAYIVPIECDLATKNASASIKIYMLRCDADKNLRLERLVEHLCDRAVDYAVPRKRIREARARDAQERSSRSQSRLVREARKTFTNLVNSGEGGELFLFVLAESLLRFPQVLCKMSLKTSSAMHYHGADGVYASMDEDVLKIHWGESKAISTPANAIRECLKSLAPFMKQPGSSDAARERDVLLVSEFANLEDPLVVEALKRYLDPADTKSTQTKNCGVALVLFDSDAYPDENAEALSEEIELSIRAALPNWVDAIDRNFEEQDITAHELHLFAVPVPSVETYRGLILNTLGVADGD